jgi:hypothetical protein
LRENTGKPQISEKAKSLSRDIKDLYEWQRDNNKKKEDLLRLKEEQERSELEQHFSKA